MGIFDRFRNPNPQIIVPGQGGLLGGIIGGGINASGINDGITSAKVDIEGQRRPERFRVPEADARLSSTQVVQRFSADGMRATGFTEEGASSPSIIGQYDRNGALKSIAVPMRGGSDRYVVLSGANMQRFMELDPGRASLVGIGAQAQRAAPAAPVAPVAAAPAAAAAPVAPVAPVVAAGPLPPVEVTGEAVAPTSSIQTVELPPSSAAPADAGAAAPVGPVAAAPASAAGTEGASVSGKLTVHANAGDSMQRYDTANGGHVYIFSDGTNMTGALYVPQGAMGSSGTYYDANQLAGIQGVRLADGKVLADGSVQTVSNTISGGQVNVAAAQSSWARNSFGVNASPPIQVAAEANAEAAAPQSFEEAFGDGSFADALEDTGQDAVSFGNVTMADASDTISDGNRFSPAGPSAPGGLG
ncbi:MAG: hypothetical protein AB7E85_06690 [Pseudobdellovibrionaceae bacterium]